MLFSKHIVSTRTLFQLTVAVVFSMVAVGAAVAANSGNPPILVPYTITTVAGTPLESFASTPAFYSGYGGDAGPAVPYVTGLTLNAGVLTGSVHYGATFNTPWGIATDSVGNLYISDKTNGLIREVNATTGNVNIVAGVTPTSCTATKSSYGGFGCTAVTGCADGVPAYQAKIGSGPEGIAVDSFDNVYFVDNPSATVSVVYRGGTRVADFIKRVNPAGVAASGGTVQVGYLYHIAGTANLGAAGATLGSGGCTAAKSTPVIDNAPAFENSGNPGAVSAINLSGPSYLSLDSAGNIYVADGGNYTVRVINTQETPQTFFQYTVQPGYARSIVVCNATLTTGCGAGTLSYGGGINGPANALYMQGNYAFGGADAYGNVYLEGGKGQLPAIYTSLSYAGGTPMTNLLTAEAPYLANYFSVAADSPTGAYPVPVSATKTPNELPLTYGNSYAALNNILITSNLPGSFLNVLVATNGGSFNVRPTSIRGPDIFGNLWYYDNHYPEISRIDQYTGDALTVVLAPAGASGRGVNSVTGLGIQTNANGTTSNYNNPASMGTPASSGATATLNPWNCVYGAQGFPVLTGTQTFNPLGDGCPAMVADIQGGDYDTNTDGLGNLYFGDSSHNIIREMPVGTQFPATAVGTATPVTQPIQVHFDVSNIPVTGGASFGSFSSAPVPDGGFLGYTTNAFSIVSGNTDFSIDTTDPEFPMGSLTTSKNNASGYNFTTTANFAMYPVQGQQGYPTCAQLGLSSPDNSWDCLVYVSFHPTQPGLRTGTLQVTTANGSVYTFQLTGLATGGQLAIDGGQPTAFATAKTVTGGLGATSSVAVTAPGSSGNYTVYIADAANNRIVVEPSNGGASSAIVNVPGVTPSTLSGPKGVAVDAAGNLYISDTGNNRVLKVTNPTSAFPTTTPAPTPTATQLGYYLWVPGSTCDGSTQAADCVFQGFATQAPGAASPTLLLGPNASPVNISLKNEPGASIGLTVAAGVNQINLTDPTTYTIPGTTGTTAPPQYQFNAPQGLAVDAWGNVYVADTGNHAVVEIPSNTALGGATPLLQYAGAPTFTTPVAVAIGPVVTQTSPLVVEQGFIFVADQGNPSGEIVRIPPGGGDLQPASAGPTSALSVVQALPLFGGNNISTPNGVAVDAAGNVYISDSSANAVWMAPTVGGLTVNPFTLNFSSGINAVGAPMPALSSPAGLALDANGNLYVADSGNNQIIFANRQTPAVNFGNVPEDTTTAVQPQCSNSIPNDGFDIGDATTGCVLTVTNIGNAPVTLASSFLGATGNSAYSVSSTCAAGQLPAGSTCRVSPTLLPASAGAYSVFVAVNGGTQTINLLANGESPQVNIVLTASQTTGTSPNLTAAVGATPTITATVKSQTVGNTPTGTVIFTAVIDANSYHNNAANPNGCGANLVSAAIQLVGGVATWTMPALAQGLQYTVTAAYTSTDQVNSSTASASVVITLPSINESAVASSQSYNYGTVPPVLTGTLSPVPPAGITVSWTSAASQYSAVNGSPNPGGNYPIQVQFSGTGACAYGFPTVYTSSGGTTQAYLTEKPVPLTVGLSQAFSTVYGAASFNFNPDVVYTGAVGPDLPKLSSTFSVISQGGALVDTSVLNVNTAANTANPVSYNVYPTAIGKPILAQDYTVTNAPGTLTVTPAPVTIGVVPAYTSTLAYGSAANATGTALTGTTGNSSSSVTLTGSSTTAGLAVGEIITGGNIASGTTIKSITDSTHFVLSANTSSSGSITNGTLLAGIQNVSYTVSVSTQVAAGKGTPSGTITLYDNFVPITSTTFIPTPSSGSFPVNATTGATIWPAASATFPGTISPCASLSTPASATCTPVTQWTLLNTTTDTVTITPFIQPYVLGTPSPYYTATGAPVPGTHYFSFVYSGDSGTAVANGTNGSDGLGNFACSVVGQAATTSPACPSTGLIPTALIVDYPDFTITSSTGTISVLPGVVPSGNGLPSLPGQNSAAQESAVLQVNGILAFAGKVSLTCTTQNPGYVNCAVVQFQSNGTEVPYVSPTSSAATQSFVLSVWTPANLPLGYNFGNTAQLRASAAKTALAFLPLGVLAFCVRRRRRLSKALWMLIAVVAVGAGMSGCGGNQVDFYTPIPTGPQTVTVYGAYSTVGASIPSEQRSFVVPILIN